MERAHKKKWLKRDNYSRKADILGQMQDKAEEITPLLLDTRMTPQQIFPEYNQIFLLSVFCMVLWERKAYLIVSKEQHI